MPPSRWTPPPPPLEGKPVDSTFFARSALTVARNLLGMSLCRRWPERTGKRGRVDRYAITEVEAYTGPEDRACHASGGRRTGRNAVMFGPPGHHYIYLCYGIHWLLNLVTGPEGHPAAVLVRGAGPWAGPGKLTQGLGLEGAFNGRLIAPESGLWVEDSGCRITRSGIAVGPRIGVAYAGEGWNRAPLRLLWKPHHPGGPNRS